MYFELYEGFHKALKGFCKNTSINAYKYMFNEKSSFYERLLWIFINVGCMIVTIFCVLQLWQVFMASPTATTLTNTNYPVEKVPFPGVSICNINKISKSRAEYLANYLVSLEKDRELNYTELFKEIGYLIHLYDFDTIDLNNIAYLQGVIEKLKPISNISLDIKPLLKYLYPPCSEVLIECNWGGSKVNCSDIFQMQLTYEGFCCLFNYQKPSTDPDSLSPKLYFQDFGINKGLTVLVNNNPNDYYRTILGSVGTKVHISHPEDYPDPVSGSFTDLLVSQDSEAFVTISPLVIEADDSVKKYPVSKRGCYFPDEKKTALGNYSQSDCYVDCRIRSMIDLCECVPFMIPYDEYKICNLENIPCLNKFKQRWNTQKPQDTKDEALRLEMRQSVICKEFCYPACDAVVYGVSISTAPMLHSVYYKQQIHNNDVDVIVHIYFGKRFAHFYRQNVIFEWFEILSNYGGIFGLFVGLSLISVVEVIIYFTYKWFLYARTN